MAIDLILPFSSFPEGTEGTLVELANHSDRGRRHSKCQSNPDGLDRSSEIEKDLHREKKHAVLWG